MSGGANLGRRRFLATSASALAFPAAAQDGRTLKVLAASKGFVFGSAAASYELKDFSLPLVLIALPRSELALGCSLLLLRLCWC